MCAGIAVYWRDFPQALVEHHVLYERKVVRSEGAEPEVQFLFRAVPRLIPAWYGGRLCVFPWGDIGRNSPLPPGGWVRLADLEAGRWGGLEPEPVDIPACFALEKGVWFQVWEGIRGVLLRDANDLPHVYLLVEPATHYYRTMTRSAWMPVLI